MIVRVHSCTSCSDTNAVEWVTRAVGGRAFEYFPCDWKIAIFHFLRIGTVDCLEFFAQFSYQKARLYYTNVGEFGKNQNKFYSRNHGSEEELSVRRIWLARVYRNSKIRWNDFFQFLLLCFQNSHCMVRSQSRCLGTNLRIFSLNWVDQKSPSFEQWVWSAPERCTRLEQIW